MITQPTSPVSVPDAGTLDFLRLVLPREGILCATTITTDGVARNTPVPSVEGLIAHGMQADAQGVNAYQALASFEQINVPHVEPDKAAAGKTQFRVQRNVKALRSLWLDIDVGEGKAAKGQGYATLDDSVNGLIEFIKATGLPKNVTLVLSGNGLHVYWALDRDVTPDEWQQSAEGLKRLCETHGLLADPARTCDSASVLRLPGTHNFKGAKRLPVQLARLGKAHTANDLIATLTRHAPQHNKPRALVADALFDSAPKEMAGEAHIVDLSGDDDQDMVQSALTHIPACIEYPVWRNVVWSIRSGGYRSGDTGETLARDWSQGCPEQFDEATFRTVWNTFNPAGGIGLGTLFRLAKEHGWVDPRTTTPLAPGTHVDASESLAASVPQHHASVILTPATDVEMEPVIWLWPQWLARGKLHMLAGQPGTGKTTIAMSVAATITTGGRWPDGTHAKVGNVMVWSGEDGAGDTLVPRLKAAGADLSRVRLIQGVSINGRDSPFDPAHHMPALQAAAKQAGDVALLIVDPVSSAVAGDSHKNTEVRRGLQPLVDLGEALGCAILGISHFSKGSQGADPAQRVIGSVGFSAVSRLVWVAAKAKDELGTPRKVLARAKSNLGTDEGGFEYSFDQVTLKPGVTANRITWGKPLDGAARDLLTDPDAPDRGKKEREVLLQTLSPDRWTKSETANAALAAFSPTRITRAREALGVIVKKAPWFQGPWYWRLPGGDDPEFPPEDAPKKPQISHVKNLTSLDSLGSSGKTEPPVKRRKESKECKERHTGKS